MPTDVLGLYLDLKARRDQEERFRAAQEAQAQAIHQNALTQAVELGIATGDEGLATGLFDRSTPLGMAGDYDAIAGAAKIGKQRLKRAEDIQQFQQTASQYGSGISGTLAPLEAARLAGQQPTAAQQAAFGQAIASASQGLGESPFLSGLIQGGVAAGLGAGAQRESEFADYQRRARFGTQEAIRQSDIIASRNYETWFNPQTGKFDNARADDRSRKARLDKSGYFPVSSIQFGGTTKDFAAGVTPTTAGHIQDKVVSLMESNDRLRILEENYDPKYFKRLVQLNIQRLQEQEKWTELTPDEQKELVGYQEYVRVMGEETLAALVGVAATTFVERLRDHVTSLRVSPELAPSVAINRIKNLRTINNQAIARLNFALKNGIVAASDFDPRGNLTNEAAERLEQAIPMNIPGFSQPDSPSRIDRLMENRADSLLNEAALNKIPLEQRSEWVKRRIREEFYTAPPIGTELQDVPEMEMLEGLRESGVILPPEEATPQLSIKRVR